jgi:protein phosphatase
MDCRGIGLAALTAMRPFDTTPEAQVDETPPVHVATVDCPVLDVAGLSDRGRVRPTNEDCFITGELRRTLVLGPSSLPMREGTPWFGCPQGKLLAVADGRNGGAAAQLASMVALRVLAGYAAALMPWMIDHDDDDQDRLRDELANAFRQCQKQIRLEADRAGLDPRAPAVVVTAVYVVWPMLMSAHVGSSRAYLLRRGDLVRLTTDDDDHAMDTRGDVDLEFSRVMLRARDRILLCTDGLVRHVGDGEIADILGGRHEPADICNRLIATANARGGEDNVTAVVGHVVSA